MRNLFYINLSALMVVIGIFIWDPVAGLLSIIPFGIFQIGLSVCMSNMPLDAIVQKMLTAHLYGVLVVVSLFLLGSLIQELLFILAMIVSLLLAILSFYMTYKQQYITRTIKIIKS